MSGKYNCSINQYNFLMKAFSRAMSKVGVWMGWGGGLFLPLLRWLVLALSPHLFIYKNEFHLYWMRFSPELCLLAGGTMPKSTFIIIQCCICYQHFRQVWGTFSNANYNEKRYHWKFSSSCISSSCTWAGRRKQIWVKGFPSLTFPTANNLD